MIKNSIAIATVALLFSFSLLAPAFTFDKKLHDFGKIPQGEPVKCTFTFTNTGDGPIILTDVKPSCGCTTPLWPKEPIMPGQKAEIKAEFNAAADGVFDKTITVHSNVDGPAIELKLKGNVEKTSKVTIDEDAQELKLGK